MEEIDFSGHLTGGSNSSPYEVTGKYLPTQKGTIVYWEGAFRLDPIAYPGEMGEWVDNYQTMLDLAEYTLQVNEKAHLIEITDIEHDGAGNWQYRFTSAPHSNTSNQDTDPRP